MKWLRGGRARLGLILFLLQTSPLSVYAEGNQALYDSITQFTRMQARSAPRPACGPASEVPDDCLDWVDRQCSDLYSEKNAGNRKMKAGKVDVSIHKGRASNGLTQIENGWFAHVLEARERFPEDFRKTLDSAGYFQKLKKVVNHKQGENPTPRKSSKLPAEKARLEAIWNSAVNSTVKARRTQTAATKVTADDLLGGLNEQIHRSIWEKSPEFLLAQNTFERVRAEYVKLIDEITDVSDEQRDQWRKDLRFVTLLIPGTGNRPAAGCGESRENSYYRGSENTVVVCGGNLLSSDVTRTITHEMGHTLGIERSSFLVKQKSAIGREAIKLAHAICERRETACTHSPLLSPEKLKSLAADFPRLESPHSQLRECLSWAKREPVDLEKLRIQITSEWEKHFRSNAYDEIYSHLLSPKELYADGKT